MSTKGVAILTDSIACLTREMMERYEIRTVSAKIMVNDHVYREYLDIDASEAYGLLEKDPERFSTSAASPADYLEAYRELSTRAHSILCITISSKLSMFHSAALLAKEYASEEIPETTIRVLDSGTAAAAEGLIVLAAARAAEEGKSLAEVARAAEVARDKVGLLLALGTVRHAYRSGRIPKVAARVGSLLSVKPILTISGGAVQFVGIARTKQRGVDRVLHMMGEKLRGNPVRAAVVHADALEEAERFKERVSSGFDCVEVWTSEFSPVMGYATGRGLVGVAFCAEM